MYTPEPKEKAKDLVHEINFINKINNFKTAKTLAIVSVDEIIKAYPTKVVTSKTTKVGEDPFKHVDNRSYWREVREQIELIQEDSPNEAEKLH